MDTYFRHPLLRVIVIFGIVFFLVSLGWITAHYYGLDGLRLPGDVPVPVREDSTVQSPLLTNYAFVDRANNRIWFFQKLDLTSGKGKGVEILFRDAANHDTKKYFAKEAMWNGKFWQLTDVRELIYDADDGLKDYEKVDLPDVTTPPSSFGFRH